MSDTGWFVPMAFAGRLVPGLLFFLGAGLALAQVDEPTLVAPGVVSTTMGEYHPSFHAAQGELYFMRRTPGRFDYTLYVSRQVATGWSEPEPLPFSGLARDAAPFIAPDGQALYFDSRRPTESLKRGSINLWRAFRDGDSWRAPELLRAPSAESASEDRVGADEFGPVVTADGSLWFYSFRLPDRAGRHYRATGPEFAEVVVDEGLPDPSASTFVSYLYLSPDGNTAILEGRTQVRGRRDSDLYYACRQPGGSWSGAIPLDAINTRSSEGGGALGTDGATLWFASDRPTGTTETGDTSLYVVSTQNLPVPCGDR